MSTGRLDLLWFCYIMPKEDKQTLLLKPSTLSGLLVFNQAVVASSVLTLRTHLAGCRGIDCHDAYGRISFKIRGVERQNSGAGWI